MKTVNEICLRLFEGIIPSKDNYKYNVKNIVVKGLKLGYTFHPKLINKELVDWLDSQPVNYNSTFYKSFNDVANKSLFDRVIDQILHYTTGYIDNDFIIPDLPLKEWKEISILSEQTVSDKVRNLIYSGIALKSDVVADVCDLISQLKIKIDINSVKNRECKLLLVDKLNLKLSSPEETLRYWVFKSTGETMIVKNKYLIDKIKSNPIAISNRLTNQELSSLSEIFYRFKPIFLAFKKGNEKQINKIRRLAYHNHKPYKFGFFENILSSKKINLNQVERNVHTLNNYKLVSLMQSCLVRSLNLKISVFNIRNNKVFIKDDSYKSKQDLENLYFLLESHLINRLKSKVCKVALHPDIDIKIPTTEKSFIGKYPVGTSIDLNGTDLFVGIHWRGKDGAHDLDLSLTDAHGNKYGWDSYYKNNNNSIMYSGDVVTANPEASEVFYAKNGFSSHIVRVNLFNGQDNSKFNFFIAREKCDSLKRNYMVDPNNIIFKNELTMDSKEKVLGFIENNKYYLLTPRMGSKRVSNSNKHVLNYIQYLSSTKDCFISVQDILLKAGFEIVNDPSEADIDLINFDKEKLISLFN